MSSTICGGFGGAKEATEDEQAILDAVKSEVEAHFSKELSVFQAISFTTQVVAGINYLIKVKCDEDIAHVKICKPLPHTNKPPFLLAIDSTNKTEDSPLEPI